MDALAYAIGERMIASVYAGACAGRSEVADRREREADAALICTRATDAAGIVCKLDIVAEHIGDERGRYGRLFDELHACIAEAAEPIVDFVHVEAALTTLARRLDREDAGEFYMWLVRSAARDARELASMAA